MGKYDELKKLAEDCKPETENAHLFGDDKYLGQHAVAVSAEQKMRKIIASYFGHPSERDWEDGDHALALASLEDYDQWLRLQKVVASPATVLALIAESERLRQIISDSATACGAAMSAECTVEFMGHLPAEIAGVLGQIRAELEHLQEQQKSAGDAGAAENCRCNEKLQVVQELQAELERARADAEALRTRLSVMQRAAARRCTCVTPEQGAKCTTPCGNWLTAEDVAELAALGKGGKASD